jgi:hypothetical protein
MNDNNNIPEIKITSNPEGAIKSGQVPAMQNPPPPPPKNNNPK